MIRENIEPYIPMLLLDQFGNYVVQCCLHMGTDKNQFVFDAIVDKCWEIGQGRFGSRAVRAILESPCTTREQKVNGNGLGWRKKGLLIMLCIGIRCCLYCTKCSTAQHAVKRCNSIKLVAGFNRTTWTLPSSLSAFVALPCKAVCAQTWFFGCAQDHPADRGHINKGDDIGCDIQRLKCTWGRFEGAGSRRCIFAESFGNVGFTETR